MGAQGLDGADGPEGAPGPPGTFGIAAANTVIVNATTGAAIPAALAVATNTVVGRVAGNVVATALVNAQVDAAAALALSKLAPQSGNSIVMNALVGSAAPTAEIIAQDAFPARVGANLVAHPFASLVGAGLSYLAGQVRSSTRYVDLPVDVPAVSAAALGYATVDTTFTALDPLAVDAKIHVLPRADMAPFSARVSATNTVRLGFQGAISASLAVPLRIYRDDVEATLSAGFIPSHTLISALSGWLRVASATVTGSGVSSLPDRIVTANPWLQATDSRRPPLVNSANGYPMLQNNGLQVLLPTSMAAAAPINTTAEWGFGAYVAHDAFTAQQCLIRVGFTAGSGFTGDSHRLEVTTGKAIIFDVHLDATGANYRRATTPINVVDTTPRFITVEFYGGGATDADKVRICVDGVAQTLTFSAIGTAAAMPSALIGTAPNMGLMNRRASTDSPLLGRMGPNVWFFGSRMSGATWLLTPAALAALARFERPT
jgi:hypothetical protein